MASDTMALEEFADSTAITVNDEATDKSASDLAVLNHAQWRQALLDGVNQLPFLEGKQAKSSRDDRRPPVPCRRSSRGLLR